MTSPSPEPLLLPLRTQDAAPFWEGCREGSLLIQKCSDCAQYQFYPRVVCVHCGSDRVEFVPTSGRAVVHAFTVCHRPLAPQFAADAPYVIALVDLDEGPRMMTNIVGCEPAEVHIGMPVHVSFRAVTDEVTLPVFEPAGGA
jgi:uncharacterized protein